jgi:RNA polymerase sigma factor (sigma-70 family)
MENLSGLSDEELFRLFQAGVDKAFDIVKSRHEARLLAIIKKCIRYRTLEPEDVLEETWVKVLRARDQFRVNSSFGGWLTRIAVNASKDANRREATGRKHVRPIPAKPCQEEGDTIDPPGREGTPEQNVLHEEERQRTAWVLGSLDKADADILRASCIEKMTLREIVAALEFKNPSAADRRLKRAHRRFRELWEQQWGSFDSDSIG